MRAPSGSIPGGAFFCAGRGGQTCRLRGGDACAPGGGEKARGEAVSYGTIRLLQAVAERKPLWLNELRAPSTTHGTRSTPPWPPNEKASNQSIPPLEFFTPSTPSVAKPALNATYGLHPPLAPTLSPADEVSAQRLPAVAGEAASRRGADATMGH